MQILKSIENINASFAGSAVIVSGRETRLFVLNKIEKLTTCFFTTLPENLATLKGTNQN